MGKELVSLDEILQWAEKCRLQKLLRNSNKYVVWSCDSVFAGHLVAKVWDTLISNFSRSTKIFVVTFISDF